MAVAASGVARTPQPSGLADVLDLILDKGLVIDVYVRLALVGIEILTLDARVVVASVDTYLRYAEAVGRLNIPKEDEKSGITDLAEHLTEGGSRGKTRGALTGATEAVKAAVRSGSDGREDEDERRPARRRRRSDDGDGNGTGRRRDRED